MSRKVESFTIHKNTLQKRQSRAVSESLVSDAKGMTDGKNVVAYAIVALRDDGSAMCAWDTGGIMPMWAFPSTVAEVVSVDIQSSGVDEDFRKPVIDKSWKGNK